MIRPARITAPQNLPLTVYEAKRHLRVEHEDEDDLIEGLIGAATSHLDGWSGVLGRCLVSQEWMIAYHSFARILRVPFPDVTAASIVYRDADDSEQSVDASNFEIKEDALGAYVWFKDSWSAPRTYARPDAVQITVTAGFGDPADVPKPICQALKLLIGHFYENREAVTQFNMRELPLAVRSLLAPYRRQQL